MANTGSRWSDVAVAVAAALDSALSIDVFDGPPTSGDALTAYVCIGANPPDSLEPNAGNIEQEYHDLGASATKDERGTIRCHLSCWSGDTDLAALRSTALGYFDTIQSTLRANPTLSLTGTRAPEIEVSGMEVRQGYSSQGIRVDLSFVLSYVCLI